MTKVDGREFQLPDNEPQRAAVREESWAELGLPPLQFEEEQLAPDIERADIECMRQMAVIPQAEWNTRASEIFRLCTRFRSWAYTYGEILSAEHRPESGEE